MKPPTRLALSLVAVLALAAAACGGDGTKFPEVVTIGEGDVLPVLASSELTVGENRFVLGLLDAESRPIVDAKVHLTFYDLGDGQERKRFEAEAASRVPARDAGLSEVIQHVHADGSVHRHFNAGDEVGVYTAVVNFDRAGWWGVEIRLESEAPKLKRTLRPRFMVLAQGQTPAIGAPAPRTRNRTVADVADLSLIDSSATPSPEMHTTTVADAIAAGRPVLVLFAVPGFCTSRFCGPEMEIMRKLYPRYRERVEFIHVEFYERPGDPNSPLAPGVAEWNLRTEPWFFVIDAQGRVAAKFEGPTSMQELEEALRKVAGAG